MMMLTDLLHTYIPMVPPFVAIVSMYLLGCLVAYFGTRDRGFLVAMITGGLFLLPYYAHPH